MLVCNWPGAACWHIARPVQSKSEQPPHASQLVATARVNRLSKQVYRRRGRNQCLPRTCMLACLATVTSRASPLILNSSISSSGWCDHDLTHKIVGNNLCVSGGGHGGLVSKRGAMLLAYTPVLS